MTDHVDFEKRGRAGILTLSRPEALNALSLDMLRAYADHLREAEHDEEVHCIVLRAEGERAFCAGADLRALVEAGRQGASDLFNYFREEYRLDARIGRLAKPHVALLHGIVIGGGAGLAMHGSHRVVCERVEFSVPEPGIGFVPDAGLSRLLARMPADAGLYLTLTGERIGAADMLWGGLATHHVPHARFEELVERLVDTGNVETTLEALGDDPRLSDLETLKPFTERLFGGDALEDILARLDGESGSHEDWARGAADMIRLRCPVALKASLALLRRAGVLSLEQALAQEFRVVSRLVQRTDFYEGVRAAILDKDRAPRWQPATLAEVSQAEIDGLLAPSPLAEPVLV